ncbi:MAG: hypothetical protein RL115_659 [Bacteroidota bacterium]|jgi:hypothetical protein
MKQHKVKLKQGFIKDNVECKCGPLILVSKRYIHMKIFTLFYVALSLSISVANAQSPESKRLEENTKSMEALASLLASEYTNILDMNKALPKNSFIIKGIRCISPYGDAGANAQTKEIENNLNSFLGESKWSFGPNTYDRPEFGVNGKLQIAAKTKTETIDYSASGALFKPHGLFDGMDIQIGVYQNKKTPSSFVFIFPVASICSAVMEVTKQ